MDSFSRTLEHFSGKKVRVGQYTVNVQCPVPGHGRGMGDREPSLSVTYKPEKGATYLHCKSGCEWEAIVDAAGLDPKDLFDADVGKKPHNDKRAVSAKKPARLRRDEANEQSVNKTRADQGKKSSHQQRDNAAKKPTHTTRYEIRNERGQLEAIHLRTDFDDGSKSVQWMTPDGRMGLDGRKASDLPLFGSEYINNSLYAGQSIVLVEGEKAATALLEQGIMALGTVTGAANTPGPAVLEIMKGKEVVLWPDNDPEGREHMKRIGKRLLGIRGQTITTKIKEVLWEGAPEKADAADADDPHDIIGRFGADFRPPHDRALDGAASMVVVASDYRALRELRRRRGGITGIPSGIHGMDMLTTGFNDGDLTVIGARTNVGKTLLANQIGLTAARFGYRALIQSPEQRQINILDRLACYVAGVNYFTARAGLISDEEDAQIEDAVMQISELPLLIDDYGAQDITRIRESIEINEPDICIIDHLQYLAPEERHGYGKYERISNMAREVAYLPGEYNIPVILLSQFSRDLEHRTKNNKAPMLSDFEGAGTIEQDADLAILMHRPWIYDPDSHDKRLIQVNVAKQRNGQTGTLELYLMEGQNWLVSPGEEMDMQRRVAMEAKMQRSYTEQVQKDAGASLLDDLDI